MSEYFVVNCSVSRYLIFITWFDDDEEEVTRTSLFNFLCEIRMAYGF